MGVERRKGVYEQRLAEELRDVGLPRSCAFDNLVRRVGAERRGTKKEERWKHYKMKVVEEDSEVARCRVRDAVWGVLGGVSEFAWLSYAGWARLGSDACEPSLCVLGGRTVWAERERKEGGDAQRPRTPGAMQAMQAIQARQVRKGEVRSTGQTQDVR